MKTTCILITTLALTACAGPMPAPVAVSISINIGAKTAPCTRTGD